MQIMFSWFFSNIFHILHLAHEREGEKLQLKKSRGLGILVLFVACSRTTVSDVLSEPVSVVIYCPHLGERNSRFLAYGTV